MISAFQRNLVSFQVKDIKKKDKFLYVTILLVLYLEVVWKADRINMRIPLEVHQAIQLYQGYIIVQVSRCKLSHKHFHFSQRKPGIPEMYWQY